MAWPNQNSRPRCKSREGRQRLKTRMWRRIRSCQTHPEEKNGVEEGRNDAQQIWLVVFSCNRTV